MFKVVKNGEILGFVDTPYFIANHPNSFKNGYVKCGEGEIFPISQANGINFKGENYSLASATALKNPDGSDVEAEVMLVEFDAGEEITNLLGSKSELELALIELAKEVSNG